MAAHFSKGSENVELGNSPKDEVTRELELESSQSELGLVSSGDATDDEVDSADSGSGRYSQCRSANFSSSRSWYHSPDNNDFMFGSADLHGFINDSGGSGDAFVDALDEYFDTERSRDHDTSSFLGGTGLYEDGLDEENNEPSTLHGGVQLYCDNKVGGVEDRQKSTGHAESGDDPCSNFVQATGLLSDDESCDGSTTDAYPLHQGIVGDVAYLHVDSAANIYGKEKDEWANSPCDVEGESGGVLLFSDKHPLESLDCASQPEDAEKATEESMQLQEHEPEVLATGQADDKPPKDISESVFSSQVTENVQAGLETSEMKEVTVAKTVEKRKCIMRLGSKEAEELLQLDVAEIVKPLRLSPLKKPNLPTDWSREQLGPDELSRYVETLDVRETYMDTVWDMEEILLDSGETSGSHSFWGTKGSGSTSTPTSVYDELWKVDSVEVVGARQRRGGASLGERVMGIREHTIYRIRVKSGGNEWEIERRYRDFVDLFQQLKRMFSAQSRVQLPSPWEKVTVESRKVFGNTSPEVVEIRSALLQVCLQSTLQAGVPMSTAAPLLRFLFPSPGEHRLPMLTSSSQFLLDPAKGQDDLQLKELGSSKHVKCGSPEKPDCGGSSTPFGNTIRLVLQIQTRKPLKQQLVNQRNLCAGCYKQLTSSGSLVSGFVQTFGLGKPRFCEYTGQVFCAGCHLNEMTILPARVLQSWDFTPKLVSQLAKAYLDSIYDQPMLCISAVNPFLYTKVPILAHVHEMRRKLNQLMNCIRCPARGRIQQVLGSRRYLLEQNDFYALRDLVDLSKGAFAVLPELLKAMLDKLSKHVTRKCSVCLELAEPCGAGILCQKSSDLIYPFQDDGIHRCQLCNAPYHTSCFTVIETCKVCTRDEVASDHQPPPLCTEDHIPSTTSLEPAYSSCVASVPVEDHQSEPKRSFLATLFGPQQTRRNSSILNMSTLLGPIEL